MADTAVEALSKNVELYGVLDFGLTWVDDEGGDSKVSGRDSVNWGNRIGLKGALDIEDGYKAVFKLEHGLKISDGITSQYGTTWGRQAYAGVESVEYGTLTYGRQYDFVYDNLNMLNIGGYASTYGGHHGDFDRISGWRVDNAFKYVSPSLAGFKFGLMYSTDDHAYAYQGESWSMGNTPMETFSAGASYYAGPWSIAAAYVKIDGNTVYPLMQLGVPGLLGEDAFGGGITADHEVMGIGGHLQMGEFTFVANTTQTTLENDVGKVTQNVYEVGGYYPIAENTLLIGGLQHSELEDYDFDGVTLGLKFDFTDYAWLYTSYSYLEGSEGTFVNQGAAWYLENSSDNKQQTARIGMILTF
eukprot:TRINITY_DN10527_c0_g1_i1.p2 TRINITY_DN10527_c0_g1~~TRINITY_DN10527_c0_g1_i1.p2  ORF type:complete len:358 (+),score=62.17 TRINITY_DN10527_c0_g1_i1:803-1876(+)